MVLAEDWGLEMFLAYLGQAAAWLIDRAKDIGATVVDTPALLIGLAVPVVGSAIGLFGRLLRRS